MQKLVSRKAVYKRKAYKRKDEKKRNAALKKAEAILAKEQERQRVALLTPEQAENERKAISAAKREKRLKKEEEKRAAEAKYQRDLQEAQSFLSRLG